MIHDYWLQNIGYWLLATDYWLLTGDYWLLPSASWLLTTDYWSQTIDDLLPNDTDAIFLLYLEKENYGHWVLLSKYNDTIEYFDSYGGLPDVAFEWGSSNFKNNEKYLSKLLNKCKLPKVYNTISFQSKRDIAISTCGAYSVFRILTLLEFNADLKQNNLMLKTLKESTDEPYDDIVVNFINKR